MTIKNEEIKVIRSLVAELFGDHKKTPENRKTKIGRKLKFFDVRADLYERELLERALVNQNVLAVVKDQGGFLRIDTMTA